MKLPRPARRPAVDTAKLKAAHIVLEAITYETQRAALAHWNQFVPHDAPYMRADEGEVAHVDALYQTLRLYATEWFNDHRFQDLYARIAALEDRE